MKLVIIRHGDPDYSIDSLTEKGWREAGYLAERVSKMDVKNFYVSPLGRARDTASLTLKKMGREAEVCEWMREFAPRINRPDCEVEKNAWDWLPCDWTEDAAYFDRFDWKETPIMKAGKVSDEYEWVTSNLDKLLEKHGYVRQKNLYKAVEPNHDTIVLFCHFGVEVVMLSHLLNVSPMVLWHGTCAAPTSVTTVVTEERRAGSAYFRMSSFGDISHLYLNGEEPAFAARFCECFTDEDKRHD